MRKTEQLLSEALRPKHLSDLNLPTKYITSLEKMEQTGSPMNLLFFGKPGIGKTTAARILLKSADALDLNGSFNKGDKSFVSMIENFSSSLSLVGKPKIVFIDEADHMSLAVQDSLRYIIENVERNARFLLTANNEHKLTSALRSRCLGISFDVPPSDRPSVVQRMTERYAERLTALGYVFDPQRLREIVGIYFPDLRNIANHLQIEFAYS